MQKKDEKKLINSPCENKKTAVSADLSGDLLHEENPEGPDILCTSELTRSLGVRGTHFQLPGAHSESQYCNETGCGGLFLKEKIQNQQTKKYSALRFVASVSFQSS